MHGLISLNHVRMRMGLEPVDLDMKPTYRNLDRVLKQAFDNEIAVSQFDKVFKTVILTWYPENGPSESGFYNYYDIDKIRVQTATGYSVSFGAWDTIFKIVELFFDEQNAPLYLMQFTAWDGTFEHLLELFPQIRLSFDSILSEWVASTDNTHTEGPPVFSRYNKNPLIASCEVVTDNILFEEWITERQESEPDWTNLQNFHEWKEYKISV